MEGRAKSALKVAANPHGRTLLLVPRVEPGLRMRSEEVLDVGANVACDEVTLRSVESMGSARLLVEAL